MKKMMLATMTLLLAGATALPAAADNDKRQGGGEQSWQGNGQPGGNEQPGQDDKQGGKGRHREESRDQRQDDRAGNRGDRQEYRADRPGYGNGAGNRDDRQDYRVASRDDRQVQRYDQRDDRRDYRDDNRQARYDNRYDGRQVRYDDGYDNRHDNDNRYRDYRGGHGNYSRKHDRRWNGYHWYPQYRYRAPARYMYPPNYRPYQWRVGHRLPHGYYGRPYYVDYNYYRLPPPPYGYGWVRVDRDVVLVALATGLIIDVLYGLYY